MFGCWYGRDVAIKKDKIRAQAQKYLQKGQINKAIREYERLVDADPQDIRALLKIGDLHARQGENSKAAQTYHNVAEAYSKQGFYLKAVALHKQILKLIPNDIERAEQLGQLYEQLGLASNAIREYESLCSYFEEKSEPEKRRELLEKIVQLDFQNATRHIHLAESYSKSGMLEEARRSFHRAISQLESESRFEDCILLCERILQSDPSDHQTAQSLGHLYLQTHQPPKALNTLQKCFQTNPRNTQVLQLLARAFEQLGHPDKVLTIYRELVRIFTNREDFLERNKIVQLILHLDPSDKEASALLESSKTNEEESPTQTLKALHPTPANSTQSLTKLSETCARLLSESQIYIKYGYSDKALAHLEKILSLEPSHREALQSRRAIFQARGEKAQVVHTLWTMALGSNDAGLLKQAKDDLEELLSLQPTFEPALKLLHELSSQTAPSLTYDVQFEDLILPDNIIENQDLRVSFQTTNIDFDDSFNAEFTSTTIDTEEDFNDFEIDWDFTPITQKASKSKSSSLALEIEQFDIDIDDKEFAPHTGPIGIQEPAISSPRANDTRRTDDNFDSIDIEQFEFNAESHGIDTTPEFLIDQETQNQFSALEVEDSPITLDALMPPLSEENPPNRSSMRFEDLDTQRAPTNEEELREELTELHFFIKQDLLEDALELLTELEERYGDHPEILQFREKLTDTREQISREQAELAQNLALNSFEAVNRLDDFDSQRKLENFSFKEVIYEFENGIAANEIQSTDYETHYDLGIAYKEMGLVTDAIREFSLSMNSPQLAVGSLTMLGQCKLEQGNWHDALSYFLRGLEATNEGSTESVALRYEIGQVYLNLEDYAQAHQHFQRGAGIDPTFRDIELKLRHAKSKVV